MAPEAKERVTVRWTDMFAMLKRLSQNQQKAQPPTYLHLTLARKP